MLDLTPYRYIWFGDFTTTKPRANQKNESIFRVHMKLNHSWDGAGRSMKCIPVCAIFSLWCAILSGRCVWALARMIHRGLEATGSHLHIWSHWHTISLCIWLEPQLVQGVNRPHPSAPLLQVQGVCPPQTTCNFAKEIASLRLKHLKIFSTSYGILLWERKAEKRLTNKSKSSFH